MSQLTCLLPAAGASSRMRGGDKLLELVDGKPCLTTMAERALEAGMRVTVTLPSSDHPRSEAIQHLPITRLYVANAAKLGMSASLVCGARGVDKASDGMMVLPPDMPSITSDDMRRIAQQFQGTRTVILRARAASGKAGHPIVFAQRLLSEFATLSGDIGAQPIVKKYIKDIEFVDFDDERPILDLDTPEDWSAWRASLSGD